MFRRQITSERNNIFPLLVSPSRINLLRGSGFACNRKTGDRDFTPRLRRSDESTDFTRQLDSGPLAKTESAYVFVESLLAHAQGKFGCADIARFDEDVADTQIRKCAMIVQGRAAEIPKTVLAKDRRIRPQFAFVESSGCGNDLKSGAGLHHVDDGPVFH